MKSSRNRAETEGEAQKNSLWRYWTKWLGKIMQKANSLPLPQKIMGDQNDLPLNIVFLAPNGGGEKISITNGLLASPYF